MRSYKVPEWLREDVAASSLQLPSIRRVARTVAGNAGEWAQRVVSAEERRVQDVLTACGCTDDQNYYGLMDPEYSEPMVIAVISLDEADTLRRWNGAGWDEVPVEAEPEGYDYVGLEGDMLADALQAPGGLILRSTDPKARYKGQLVAAADTGGPYFAVVDDFDTSAVLDLIKVEGDPPVAYVRRDGDWVEDPVFLGRFRSVDPPRAVQVQPDGLDAIVKQVDEFDRAHADAEPVVARGIYDEGPTQQQLFSGYKPPAPAPAAPAKKTVAKQTVRKRAHAAGSGRSWDEAKYNRVDGKFAKKGAVDNTPGRRVGASRGRKVGQTRGRAPKKAPDYSPTGSAVTARFEDGSARYADGTKWDPEQGVFKNRDGSIMAQQSSKRPTAARTTATRTSTPRATSTATKTAAPEPTPAEKALKAEQAVEAQWDIDRRKADLEESQRRGTFNDQMSEAYSHFDPSGDGSDSQLAEIMKVVQDEQRRRASYDRAREYESQLEEIRRMEVRLKMSLAASVGLRASVPEHSVMPHKLKSYWTRGEGAAKIRWGVGGDFKRCERHLRKYLNPTQVAGACANLHKAATGTWPGKGRKHGVTAAAYDGNGSMIALEIPREQAEQLVSGVNDGTPPEEMHVTLAYLGEDVDPEVLEAARQVTSGVAAEYNAMPATLGGRGQFMSDEPANYVSVDAVGLEGMRADLVERLARAGVPVNMDHGFTPHTTLSYGPIGEEEWPELPLESKLGTIKLCSGQQDLGSWEMLP